MNIHRSQKTSKIALFVCFLSVLFVHASTPTGVHAQAALGIDFVEEKTGEKIAARIEFIKPAGKNLKPKNGLSFGKQSLVEGSAKFSPPPGDYEFLVRRGPEFGEVHAGFTVEKTTKDSIEVVVPHKTPMRFYGWHVGDLRCSVDGTSLRRWMAADDLDLVATNLKPPPTAGKTSNEKKTPTKRNDPEEKRSQADLDNDLDKKEDQAEEDSDANNGSRDAFLQDENAQSPRSLGIVLGPSVYIKGSDSRDCVLVHSIGVNRDVVTDEDGKSEAKKVLEAESENGLRIELESDDTVQGGIKRNPLPSSAYKGLLKFLSHADSQVTTHVEIIEPWHRDVPLLLASKKIDSIQILSSHLRPESQDALNKSIRNPDPLRFKGPNSLGRLGEYLYWQMLEAGFRIPPTAGSGFDMKSATHAGYNRVYVWLDPSIRQRDPDAKDIDALKEIWWQQLRSGHVMVTNGPLMRVRINGMPPGAVMAGYRNEPIMLDIELDLTVRDPVEYLDVIFNGRSIYQARLDDHNRRGMFPPLSINESGWLVLRVVTEHEKSYRLAATAPFYFEFEGTPRISREAVKFFSKWLAENKGLDADELESATDFWKEREAAANAE